VDRYPDRPEGSCNPQARSRAKGMMWQHPDNRPAKTLAENEGV
jgi:hypothetical protein